MAKRLSCIMLTLILLIMILQTVHATDDFFHVERFMYDFKIDYHGDNYVIISWGCLDDQLWDFLLKVSKPVYTIDIYDIYFTSQWALRAKNAVANRLKDLALNDVKILGVGKAEFKLPVVIIVTYNLSNRAIHELRRSLRDVALDHKVKILVIESFVPHPPEHVSEETFTKVCNRLYRMIELERIDQYRVRAHLKAEYWKSLPRLLFCYFSKRGVEVAIGYAAGMGAITVEINVHGALPSEVFPTLDEVEEAVKWFRDNVLIERDIPMVLVLYSSKAGPVEPLGAPPPNGAQGFLAVIVIPTSLGLAIALIVLRFKRPLR